MASWYGQQFHGRPTANGEIFDMRQISAAHPTLPMPSLVEVTNLENGRSMKLRVNDRGPFHDNRLIDLSQAAARELGFEGQGLGPRARPLRLALAGQWHATRGRHDDPPDDRVPPPQRPRRPLPARYPRPAARPPRRPWRPLHGRPTTAAVPASAQAKPRVAAADFVQVAAFGERPMPSRLAAESRARLGRVEVVRPQHLNPRAPRPLRDSPRRLRQARPVIRGLGYQDAHGDQLLVRAVSAVAFRRP
jgi:rare lipoprotein A